MLGVTGGSAVAGPTTINANVGDSITVTVNISRTAGERIDGATLAFAVTDIGGALGNSGVVVNPPSMTDSTDWDGTIWDTNQNAFFSATRAGTDQPDQATLTILNGLFSLSQVAADGVLAPFQLDLTNAIPGAYQLTPDFAGASLFTNSSISSSISPSSTSAMLNIAAVPEPSAGLFLAFACLVAKCLSKTRLRRSELRKTRT